MAFEFPVVDTGAFTVSLSLPGEPHQFSSLSHEGVLPTPSKDSHSCLVPSPGISSFLLIRLEKPYFTAQPKYHTPDMFSTNPRRVLFCFSKHLAVSALHLYILFHCIHVIRAAQGFSPGDDGAPWRMGDNIWTLLVVTTWGSWCLLGGGQLPPVRRTVPPLQSTGTHKMSISYHDGETLLYSVSHVLVVLGVFLSPLPPPIKEPGTKQVLRNRRMT